jgi:hypothetical protein
MFDDRSESLKRSPSRPLTPPQPVVADLASCFGPRRLRWGQETPLWARSGGFRVDREAPGTTTEWLISEVGDWWAVATVRLSSSNGLLVREVGLLLPATAVKPV